MTLQRSDIYIALFAISEQCSQKKMFVVVVVFFDLKNQQPLTTVLIQENVKINAELKSEALPLLAFQHAHMGDIREITAEKT